MLAFLVLAAAGSSAASGEPAAGPTGTRILYAGDWTGRMQVFAADPAGRAKVGQLTFGPGGFTDPTPSPNGRHVAYLGGSPFDLHESASLWVARANGSKARRLAASVVRRSIAWSPDSTRLAYVAGEGVHVTSAGGSGDRVVAKGHTDVAWSPDGTTLAFGDPVGNGIAVLRQGRLSRIATELTAPPVWLAWSPDGRWITASFAVRPRTLAIQLFGLSGTRRFIGLGEEAAWSPDGTRLAVLAPDGLRVTEVRSGRARLLTRDTAYGTRSTYTARSIGVTWSPDGRSLAYVVGTLDPEYGFEGGDLRTVTLSGRVRTIVDADRRYGGHIVSVAWARPPQDVRYRASEPAPKSRVGSEHVLAGGPIERLAADGDRVAFTACFGVYLWTPAKAEAQPIGQSAPLRTCRRLANSSMHSLALAGDRLAYGQLVGCTSRRVLLFLQVLPPSGTSTELAGGSGACAAPYRRGVGFLAGAADLLVFGTIDETCSEPVGCGRIVTTSQEISRVDAGACPCPVIASSPGPLAPGDVEGNRVVAFGENETLVLDAEGRRLLSVAVSPLAAQLSGPNLVLLRQGELRHHDATTGELRHVWPLPDVPSGGGCELQCLRSNDLIRLRLLLQDAARGLVAYVLDGRVHLLRLSDGADAAVARGTLARFLDAGLVYADGSRLHLVPFERLPLR